MAHSIVRNTLIRCAVTAAAAVLVAACGGGSGSSSPMAAGPSTASSTAISILSCSTISYRGQTLSASCSIPGESQQPSGVSLFFGWAEPIASM